jgi:phosphate transport system substrate-binding protein
MGVSNTGYCGSAGTVPGKGDFMKKSLFVLPAAALLAACGNSPGGGSEGAAIKVVGSSTVYPFTTMVAEEFQRGNPGINVVVESTGSGAGIKLFCGGIGANTPDLVNSSRRMKTSEFELCRSSGVNEVVEIPVGIDGLAFIMGRNGPDLDVTQAEIYEALAANPYGRGPNTSRTWQDINPRLPASRIRVLGPPPTSGTRDSLVELYLEKGCTSDPAMKALKEENENQFKEVCTRVREDNAFVEAGENDNLIVQKVAQDPGTVGILGYSFLEANADRVKPVTVNGVTPTEATISSLEYPGARKMFVYLKGAHVPVKPSLREFMQNYARMWVKGGPLERRGLVPLAGADLEASTQQAAQLRPLEPGELK